MKQSLRRFLAVLLASGIVATGSVTVAFAADYDQEWEQFQDASASMDENTRAALAGSIVGSLSQDSSSDPIEMQQMILQQQLALLDAKIQKQLTELTLLREEIRHENDIARCLHPFSGISHKAWPWEQVQHDCGLTDTQMLKYVSSTGQRHDELTWLTMEFAFVRLTMEIHRLGSQLQISQARLHDLTVERNMVYARMRNMR